jgi:hypothetical protein
LYFDISDFPRGQRGGRVHPQIAWAKLRVLRRGARSRARSCGVEFKSACGMNETKEESLDVKV